MDDIDFSLPVGELGAYLWRHGCAAWGASGDNARSYGRGQSRVRCGCGRTAKS